MGKFKSSPGVNSALTNMGAKKVGVLSRGQRKRLAKKNNLVAKKSFVKVLTALDEKDKKKKKYGRLQVGDVSKMFEDVAKEIASRNPYALKKRESGADKANRDSQKGFGNNTVSRKVSVQANNTNKNGRRAHTKNIVSAKNKKSKKIIREELELFSAVNKHPGFQAIGGLNAIQQHLKNMTEQGNL